MNTIKHCEIPLTQGRTAIVDHEDYAWLMEYKWRAVQTHGVWYARTDIGLCVVYMHRLVMGCDTGKIVDHRDGDGLNNRKVNLRYATYLQNQGNRTLRKVGKSKFKGVLFHSQNKNWVAQCRRKHIGSFLVEEDAARAYDSAAVKEFGEYAKTNFPQNENKQT